MPKNLRRCARAMRFPWFVPQLATHWFNLEQKWHQASRTGVSEIAGWYCCLVPTAME